MKSYIPPEQRQWTVNKKEMTPVRKEVKRCGKCKIVLSQYNMNKYCFIHAHFEVKEKDRKAFAKQRSDRIKYQKPRRNK